MRPSCRFVYAFALASVLISIAVPLTAQIASITPESNPGDVVKPGDAITIAGAGFGAPGTLKIGTATVPVPATDWTPASIKATVPDIAPGKVDVVVTPAVGAALSSTLIVAIPTLPIEVIPKVIQPANGKLPASMTLAIYEKNCDDKTGTNLSQGVSAPYTASITGAGLMLSSLRASKCSISANLAIDPNSAGPYTVFLYDQKGNQVGSADMGVLDSGASPIPPGINPEVDVMWEVMSQDNCSDAFGKRVAHSLYCIQVKIGNNSGHPIQLAGIGFTNSLKALAALGSPTVLIANTSYVSTRAVLVESQLYSTRNIIANSLQGAGLILSASTPFFSNSTDPLPKLHFTTLTNIVGNAATQAYNIIVPDRIVSQLKSLDDQSFRDNLIVANNSQAQTVVFVEKQSVTIALQGLQQKIAQAANAASGQAQIMDDSANEAKANASQAQLRAATSNAAPDITAAREAMTDAEMKNAKAENLKAEAKTLSDIERSAEISVRNSTRPGFRKRKSNPLLVKLALGDIVIVGNQIEYLQRVQVQSNPGSIPGSTLSAQPASLQFPDQTVALASTPQTVTFTNTGTSPLSNLQFVPSGANKAEFSIGKNTCTSPIAPATPCTVDVVFTPDPTQGAAPARKASLDVSASTGSTLISVPLSGNAKSTPPPPIVFSQTTLSFTTQKPNATLTMVNLTAAPVTIAVGAVAPAAGTPAAVFGTHPTNKCPVLPATLAAGNNCTVAWTFTPAAGAAGPFSATAQITVNSAGVPVAGSPTTITLSGTTN